MEIQLYEISEWVDYEKYYLSISHNSHPAAVNILYANINSLKNYRYFHLTKDTVYLHDQLQKHDPFYYHISRLAYYRCTKMEQDMKTWKTELPTSLDDKYQLIRHVCQTLPLCEIQHIPRESLNWFHLSSNQHPCVIQFLIKNRHNIVWGTFVENSADMAVDYMLEEERNGWSIDWSKASSNTNEKMISQFPKHKESLSAFRLSSHSSDSVITFLLNEMYEKIHWENFCANPNEIAVNHIINNPQRIVWSSLCENTNPRIFPILRENQDKIVWENFLKNPICFQYDYKKMEERILPLKEELRDIFMHPDNIMAKINSEKGENETDFDTVSRMEFM